jgi:hypothetical protein
MEFAKVKKLRGYKLVKSEFWKTVNDFLNFSNLDYTGLRDGITLITEWGLSGSSSYDIDSRHPEYLKRLKDSGILDIWFEPVYEKDPEYMPFTFEDREFFRGKWVRTKVGNIEWFVGWISIDGISGSTSETDDILSYEDALKKLEFLDGSPFGKIKE